MHPDKDIILEYNANEKPTISSCGCSSCKAKGTHEKYMNATGDDTHANNGVALNTNSSNLMAHQTTTIFVFATLVIVASLMYKNK